MRRFVVPVLLLTLAVTGGCAGRLDPVREPGSAGLASVTTTHRPYIPADVGPLDITNIRGLPPAPEIGVAARFVIDQDHFPGEVDAVIYRTTSEDVPAGK